MKERVLNPGYIDEMNAILLVYRAMDKEDYDIDSFIESVKLNSSILRIDKDFEKREISFCIVIDEKHTIFIGKAQMKTEEVYQLETCAMETLVGLRLIKEKENR